MGPLIPMPRFARQLLTASLLALYATVMLCGPCLHGLPGLGHDRSVALGVDSDDCSVCHCVSQAQLPIDVACQSTFEPTCVWREEASYVSAVRDCLHLTSPRAPPVSADSLS